MIQVEASRLSKSYGKHTVFTDLSFKTTSPVVGIAGRNGAGKSTLLKCIAGLLKPTSGSVVWKNGAETEITSENLKKVLGYAAPYINLYDELTVTENLTFLFDVRNENNRGHINTVLKRTGSEPFKKSPFGALSTGQQQRARLAAAIVHQPRILFLDEPGSNLDEKGRALVLDLVNEFRDKDKLLLLASNQSYELDLCDSIIDLNK
jgi:ABC-type multidrug transport system ATPase subunit